MAKIDFSKRVVALAPLAGFSDLPFRSVVKKFGVDLTFSEMISANALVRDSKKTFDMLKKSPLEEPYIVQIAVSDPQTAKRAVEILNDIEGIDGIDLNCGCPVPKVVSQNSGSSLLLDLPNLGNILETIKKTSNKTYTSAKVRLGFNEKIPKLIAKTVENAGADFISMHGRTRAGGYKAEVDYQAIKEAKEVIRIPLFANGDIKNYQQAVDVQKFVGCEGIMIGRGAIGNPWIFYQLKNSLGIIDDQLKKEIILEHLNQMVNFYGDSGIKIFRKHLHRYSKGRANASEFRDKINRIDNLEKMRDELEIFF